jgi:1,4-dihydroxy-2-naphthoyl-CoA synthase
MSTAVAAWDDGNLAALAAVRIAVEHSDELLERLHVLLLDAQERHGPDGLLALATGLALVAGNAVSTVAGLAGYSVSDVLDQAELAVLAHGQS